MLIHPGNIVPRRGGMIVRSLVFSAVLLGLAEPVNSGEEPGAERPPASREDRLVEERTELMRQLAAGYTAESQEAGFPERLEPKPIFRYTDPARGTIAASLWRLGSTGRPKALLAMELNRSELKAPAVMYEYSSLTATPFSLRSRAMRWSPARTLYEFKPLPGMRPPEKTAARRLIQMRDAANRFASSEIDKKERCELRLLSQPADRYKPAGGEAADGAMFLFVFGTNPEVVLFLESDGTDWTYAVGRMTGAETVTMTLDGKTVWDGPPLESGPQSPYTGSFTPIAIPGFGPDGKELAE